MHGGTQRQEKPFSAVYGWCDVAHAADKKPPDGGVDRVLRGLDAVWLLT